MKKILIAGYPDSTRGYRNAFAALGVFTDALPLRETAASSPAGQPVPSSRTEASVDAGAVPSLSGIYHALVLPGGGDIAPILFGAENKGSQNIDESLDRIQLYLLDAFLYTGKPVLGICKGLQILNVYFGGTLIQDLPESSRHIHAYQNGDRIHPTKAARGTFAEKLYGGAPVTNSAHHQGIGTVGDGLLVAQYSHDFVIEAMYHEKFPLLGVQWHPERMCFACANPRMEDGSLLLRYFLSLL